MYRDGEWRLASDIDNPQGPETRVYHFGGHFGGTPDDVPVTGDWDGSGKSKIGVYRPSTGEWLLDYNVAKLKAPSAGVLLKLHAPVAPQLGDLLAAACVDFSVLPRGYLAST